MDRIDALRLFCSVAELGSFTKAAEREAMTPGAASKQITALEQRLQARLFERTTRSVRLTDAGSALLERVLPWLSEYDALAEGVAEARSAPAGTLRIAAPVDFGAPQPGDQPEAKAELFLIVKWLRHLIACIIM